MKPGQALVMLLVFVATAVVVASAAVIMIIVGSAAASKYETSQQALATAESGAENALIRLLRDPSYTGETLTITSSTATITVTGTDPMTIVSTAVSGEFTRTVQVTARFINDALAVTSWNEQF